MHAATPARCTVEIVYRTAQRTKTKDECVVLVGLDEILRSLCYGLAKQIGELLFYTVKTRCCGEILVNPQEQECREAIQFSASDRKSKCGSGFSLKRLLLNIKNMAVAAMRG